MAWFADLAGKAETLLNNLDEQTGAALRNHNSVRKKERSDCALQTESAPWNQKRRPVRTTRKPPQITETRSNYYNPTGRVSPNSRPSRSQTKDSNYVRETTATSKSPMRKPSNHVRETTATSKSPTRKPSNHARETTKTSKSPRRKSIYNLDHCPDTLVGDFKDNPEQFGIKHRRRCSLPTDLEIMNQKNFDFKMQDLEVENAMLKNELNVMNREVSELVEKLRKTEDGNDVVSEEELQQANLMLENSDSVNHKMKMDKDCLTSQLEVLKRKVLLEIPRHRERNRTLDMEVTLLRERNKELEDLVRHLNDRITDQEATQSKLENELRHAQTHVNELESNLERTTAECRRLEKDWDAYKMRVKSMLFAKDKEIKALQEGLNLTEDTKILIEQIDCLKEEREVLSEAMSRLRSECADTRRHLEQLESKHGAAERVVTALREALRDERSAKTRADSQCTALAKEIKSLQAETNHIISSLRSVLLEKDEEISRLREIAVRSTDTSALNVADYDDMQSRIDSDKIHYLTQTLVQKQGKVDTLLAENNMLKIQMEKMESKYKSEITSLRAQSHQNHSVVHVQDDVRSRRTRSEGSVLTGLSRRFSGMLRYPVFRMFMLFYMVGLHFWVLTVLFTSTPEGYSYSKQKSHS